MASQRSVTIDRISEHHYRATAPSGATLEFGVGEGLLSPVELLLAAIAGCSAVDVDAVTTRRSEPERFVVEASGEKGADPQGRAEMSDLKLSFDLAFPDTEAGRAASGLVERCVRLSHDKLCTVSRTVENGTPVAMEIVAPAAATETVAPAQEA